jgi:c(7)-type cytochrome triheme protein
MGIARPLVSFLLLAVILEGAALGKTIPPPEDYGMVMIGRTSAGATMPPVRFDHWLHRAFYTCRVCHVEIGFAMEADGTGITAETNAKGFHCGTCHNGTTSHGGKKIFPACPPGQKADEGAECTRCHGSGKNNKREHAYASFVADLPKEVYGNLVDWEKAEARGLIRPVDELPDMPGRPRPPGPQEDFSIASQGRWMPDIIFSHKKHAQWNGCEVCHPEIFFGVKKGATKYSMFAISEGEYCGACHDRVAFPLNDCMKCHANRPPR